MIDSRIFEQLLPAACEWAHNLEEFVLARGAPLGPQAAADAIHVGVKDPALVRVLVVEKIPLPEDPLLAEASRRAGIITEASSGVTLGHGVIIRADRWGDRELLVHQLVHVAQCERCGGREAFVRQYLSDRKTSADFTVGSLEDEARRIARELCAGASA